MEDRLERTLKVACWLVVLYLFWRFVKRYPRLVFGFVIFCAVIWPQVIVPMMGTWGPQTVTVVQFDRVDTGNTSDPYDTVTGYYGVNVVLTEQSTLKHSFDATVAVCSVVGNLDWGQESQSWNGSSEDDWRYIGRRRLLISMFAVPQPETSYQSVLPAADVLMFDTKPTPTVQTVAYVLTTPSDAITSSDTIEWCKLASSWQQLNAELPAGVQVNKYGFLIGRRLTWLDQPQGWYPKGNDGNPTDPSVTDKENDTMLDALQQFNFHSQEGD